MKCETCEYFDTTRPSAGSDDYDGWCRRYPHIEDKFKDDKCGEWAESRDIKNKRAKEERQWLIRMKW